MSYSKRKARYKRHRRVRKKLYGTSDKPRLNVFKSLNHIYAQVIDDMSGNTLVSAATVEKGLKAKGKTGGNIAAAKEVGTAIAKKAMDKGIKKIVFDRGGYLFHGKVKALADAAREGGLKF